MTSTDPRHGTNAGYIAGCREQCCRSAHAAYQKRRRTRVYLARGPMRVDSTGTRRRVRALVALGHTFEDMDTALGKARGYTFNMTKRDKVFRATALDVLDLYERWSMTVPTGRYAARNRGLARRKGWLPPLAWDDDRIDDPAYRPTVVKMERVRGKRQMVDESEVELILDGNPPSRYTSPAEKREVVRRWRGSHNALARLTGWKVERYVDRDGAA